jgi:hypothetical protein
VGAVVKGSVLIDMKRLPEALRRDEEAVRAGIVRGVNAGLERGRAIMVKATPVDQGQLRASWHVMRRVNGARGLNTMGTASVGELRNDAPHAGIVELGARPHGLSPAGWAALYEWVRRHPELWAGSVLNRKGTLVSGPAKRDRRARTAARGPLRPYHGPDPVIESITNAIAMKLRREGQKPTYFIRQNLYRVGDAVANEIKREIDLLAEKAGGYARG